MTEWADVGRALLGSWPGLVSAWGQDAIAAYVDELAARGLAPEEALVGLRSCEADTPPNAGLVLELARRDPDEPTFEEMVHAVWGPDGVLRPRSSTAARQRMRIANCSRGCEDGWIIDDESNTASPCDCRGAASPAGDAERLARAGEFHPMIEGFVVSQGLDRLKSLGLGDLQNEYREARRKELRRAWDDFRAQQDRREVAALVGSPPRRQLERSSPRRLDAAAVIGEPQDTIKGDC